MALVSAFAFEFKKTMVLLLTVCWFACVILISQAITRMVTSATNGFVFRLLVFPGVLVHELSHYVACKLTGARVEKVQLFGRLPSPDSKPVYGGYVMHGPSKLPLVGDLLISFAPVFGGLGTMTLLTVLAGDPLGLDQSPAEAVSDDALPQHNLQSAFWGMIFTMGRLPMKIYENFTSWSFWGYLYLTASMAVALAPSRQDFANSWQYLWKNFLWLVLLLGVMYLVSRILGTFIDSVIAPYLVGLFAYTISILLIVLVLTTIVTRVWLLIRRRPKSS
ncbi:zinc metalloprotease [Thalassoroseus pseudoceratinae]|uniref:hypothetical protein n=1 Tax=Thalassoroseus pseudoceratinae TaxID=2713176 RepID=UPI00141F9064|nr:hypothetical protein [Thalassoroseus pseudoceratinae]